ncbi:MAG: response regulator [Gammaproteobacteria bacterium]|nr:response regulator [Gammaproteobacteria bacterium]MBU1440901.1 response regulator [Gammaproteobacteria bacterium]MBU2288687.1 response regulator [Gammaproteobacteria bacterium]MBU2411083.1 response regulator [Gammaproteobacteria bacterium]
MATITYLVEDNSRIRENLIPTLEDLGNARVVGFAETDSDAVEWLKAHDGEWDLAVVDLFLRDGSSGLEVLKGCRDRQAHQQVVILTNYATDEMRRQCLALGADAVFDKSTELEGLLGFASDLGTPTGPT